jgi:putative flippase GtrA
MEAIRNIVTEMYMKFRNLILYGIIGSFSAGVDFMIFYSLTKGLNIYYLYANVVSVTAGITISFLLNKKFNFKVEDKVVKRFLIFFAVGFSGLLLSLALLYVFIDVLALGKLISKLLSIILVVLLQFFANKFITFNKAMK